MSSHPVFLAQQTALQPRPGNHPPPRADPLGSPHGTPPGWGTSHGSPHPSPLLPRPTPLEDSGEQRRVLFWGPLGLRAFLSPPLHTPPRGLGVCPLLQHGITWSLSRAPSNACPLPAPPHLLQRWGARPPGLRSTSAQHPRPLVRRAGCSPGLSTAFLHPRPCLAFITVFPGAQHMATWTPHDTGSWGQSSPPTSGGPTRVRAEGQEQLPRRPQAGHPHPPRGCRCECRRRLAGCRGVRTCVTVVLQQNRNSPQNTHQPRASEPDISLPVPGSQTCSATKMSDWEPGAIASTDHSHPNQQPASQPAEKWMKRWFQPHRRASGAERPPVNQEVAVPGLRARSPVGGEEEAADP
ncbi:hypothetical protein D623_10009613 [Myotis brandtii]|uniref:Uncharacterized protein n=1 Tax=Myotis brandtii TaxID=109478 RepID=S7PJ01_MYOBR|nr:hypothetical protein D623_10009613 [Myotis brandtii]